MLWRYVKPYVGYALIGALFMAGEVLMDLAQPGLMSQVVDVGVLGVGNDGVGDLGVVFKFGLIMCACALIGTFFGSANNVFVQIAKQRAGNAIRKDAYRAIMDMSFSQVEKFGTGALITRVTNDVSHIEMMVGVFVRGLIRTGLMMVGSIVMLFSINPGFGAILLVAFPIALGIMVGFLRVVNPLFLRIQERLDRLNAIMQEDLVGIRTVKAFVREVYEKVRFGKANDELIKTQLQALVIFAFMSPLMNVLMYGSVAGLLLLGYQGSLSGDIMPGQVIASISYATQLLMSIMGVVMLAQDISRGTTSWKRVKEVLCSKPEMADGAAEMVDGATEMADGAAGNAAGNAADGAAEMADGAADNEADNAADKRVRNDNVRGVAVEMHGVTFAYPDAAAPVLRGVDLAIRPGEMVVIMGSTGCGKSTLVNLIPRFYDVTEGAVLVDGVDVRAWNRTELRRCVVPVLQRTELFAGSLEDNVAWGAKTAGLAPGAATDEAISRALRVAQVDEFVDELPGGVKAELATGGANLSGGQRQRVGIARGLAANPRVLILDDVTSALDTRTEARFLSALHTEYPSTTKIVVAQRISVAHRADRIIVLDEGRIVGEGTHAELMGACPVYRDIVASQMEVDVDA